MDPWTAMAKAVVYPLAKAIADAWFDARAKYDIATEERVTDEDRARAGRFADAVRVQHPANGDTRPKDSAPGGGGNVPSDMGSGRGR